MAVVLACVAAALSGCTTLTPKKEIELTEVAFSFDEERSPYGVFSEYRIAPGDLLDVLYQIKTWKEQGGFSLAVDHTVSVKFPRNPELNEIEKIRPDGKISLPYLGEIYVLGKTVEELTEELKERYTKVFKEPELYVVIPEFRSAIRELKTDLHTAPRGLSRLVTVRPDGNATFGMVGDVFVAGRTLPEVNAELNERYDNVLPGLQVDLFLERSAGSLIYVMGEVDRPGSFQILKPTTVLEALSLAGSSLPSAKLSEVLVVRRKGQKLYARRVNVHKSLTMSRKAEFFLLQPDDVVYVPKRTVTKVAELARELQDIVMFRGWGISLSYDLDEDDDDSLPEATVDALLGE